MFLNELRLFEAAKIPTCKLVFLGSSPASWRPLHCCGSESVSSLRNADSYGSLSICSHHKHFIRTKAVPLYIPPLHLCAARCVLFIWTRAVKRCPGRGWWGVRLLPRLWWATVTAERPHQHPPHPNSAIRSQSLKKDEIKGFDVAGLFLSALINNWPHLFQCFSSLFKRYHLHHWQTSFVFYFNNHDKLKSLLILKAQFYISVFFSFFPSSQWSQTSCDKDDGWGRTLAPAEPSSFLGAQRYWGGAGGVDGSRPGGGCLVWADPLH